MSLTPFVTRRLGQWIAFSGLGVIAGVIWYFWTYNMLMPDAEMIAHFKVHRADMEYLVKHHQSFDPSKPPYVWDRPKEARAAKERAGVQSVGGAGPLWLPDPYTGATAYHAMSLVDDRMMDARKTEGVVIYLNQRRDSNSLLHMYPWIWKEFMYIPVEPSIKNGRLLEPWEVHRNLAGKRPNQYVREVIVKDSSRVFDSLDGYPPGWKRGECVFKPIESQWFLRMCRAAM